MTDRIRLEAYTDEEEREERSDSLPVYLRIFVNERELLDAIRDVEQPFADAEGHPGIAGAYGALALDRLDLEPGYLHGSRPFDDRVALYVCGCGEEGCWPFMVHVATTAQTVTWSSFEQPHREWTYDALGPFTFDRAEYDREVAGALAAVQAANAAKEEVEERFARRYECQVLLGEGDHGVVLRAVDRRIERLVALRILATSFLGDTSSTWASDATARERLLREWRRLASLDHPHIVTIYDADEWEGRPYVAMRYLDGPTLRAIVEEDGGLAPDRAVDIVAQVADALDAAHAAGLVHGNVTPGNIFVLPPAGGGDHAYLSDFGLPAASAEPLRSTDPVDHRADVYALGFVLVTCLTGSIPAVLPAAWEPPPRVSETRPDLVPFDAVIATALAIHPAERYQTAGALAAAARAALAERAERGPGRAPG